VTDAEAIELVLHYQAGEPAALEALYARLRPAVLALLRPYRTAALPGTLAPQDVTQQSWVVLAELASRWRPQGSFLAYFFRSFPRRMRRYVRQAGSSRTTRAVKLVSLPHDELVGQVDRALAEPAADAALGWLEPLGELPPEQRVAVALRILEERDFASIGQVLHVSRATAHRLYRQALKQLAADV
jgi:RNA polymerase sigma factor (sigma-70 family)